MITYLNFTGIAEKTGISSGYLRQLRIQDKLPAPDAMVGEYPGWLPATIEAWSAARTNQKTPTANG